MRYVSEHTAWADERGRVARRQARKAADTRTQDERQKDACMAILLVVLGAALLVGIIARWAL